MDLTPSLGIPVLKTDPDQSNCSSAAVMSSRESQGLWMGMGSPYAQIELFLNDWAMAVAGKSMSRIGQFQQSLRPALVNQLPGRPADFIAASGGEPLSGVGVDKVLTGRGVT
jgi:hypothetical protein